MSFNGSDNDDSDACHLAKIIMTSHFKGAVLAECIIAPFVFAPNLLLLWAICRVTVFPTNLRMMLGYLACTFLAFATATLVKGIYMFISPPCSFAFNERNCRIFELFTSSMILPNLYFCLTSLCIERLYATVRFRYYDTNSKPWLGSVLLVLSWSIMFSIYCSDVFYLPTDRYVPICESTFLPSRSPYLLPGYLVLECVTMSMTIFTYLYNRHVARNMAINRALYDLSARFLVDQNVQVNAIVMPSVALHLIAHIPMMLLLIPVSSSLSGITIDPHTRALINRSTLLWRLLYAIADPLLAFYFNVHLRQNLARGPFGKAMKRLGVNIGKQKIVMFTSHTAVHFEYLEKSWAHAKGGKSLPSEIETNARIPAKSTCC